MAFKPLIALHKDAEGNILNATVVEYSYGSLFRAGDLRPGDRVEFLERVDRTEKRDPATVEPLAIVPDVPEKVVEEEAPL